MPGETKKIIFSGVQPSGNLTIGNYLGALKNWKIFQDEYNCFYCVVDMHAITLYQEPASLRHRTLETLAIYIACGLDPDKVTLFVQSHVPAHAELSWVLGCNTMFGELSRMTQFKDKAAKNEKNINAGLFTYPVLMAADILLYQADLVPVGEDQKQHIELARDVAERFNRVYSPTFVIPEPYMVKGGTKIMSLTDPDKKMSKSDDNQNSFVLILDDKDTIIKKFKRAVTDSGSEIRYNSEGGGISNLMNIYSCFTGKKPDEIEREFAGSGYGYFKEAVGEACADGLAGVRSRYNELISDIPYLEAVMDHGAQKASAHAGKTLSKVYRKIGFYRPNIK
ncbi:MAG: tryptophan--tRNA ligase [Oscillospiraceae bacterium]|nr:tryptophan--tRNA ligase [Oscillospiraceae bacterium]